MDELQALGASVWYRHKKSLALLLGRLTRRPSLTEPLAKESGSVSGHGFPSALPDNRPGGCFQRLRNCWNFSQPLISSDQTHLAVKSHGRHSLPAPHGRSRRGRSGPAGAVGGRASMPQNAAGGDRCVQSDGGTEKRSQTRRVDRYNRIYNDREEKEKEIHAPGQGTERSCGAYCTHARRRDA